VLVSDEEGISPLMSRCIGQIDQMQSTREMNEHSIEESTETDSTSFAPEPPPRCTDPARRRSSIGQLAHFIKRNSVDSKASDNGIQSAATHSKGITEMIQNFQFRPQNQEKIQQRKMEQRQGNPDYLLAQSKRKRMADYAQQTDTSKRTQ